MRLLSIVGCCVVETGQLPALHTTYSLLYTPSLNQRCWTDRLNRSVVQFSVASSFQCGVLPALTPALCVGIVPGTPESVMKFFTLVARPRSSKRPGRPTSPRLN